jgi:hypothetical protein
MDSDDSQFRHGDKRTSRDPLMGTSAAQTYKAPLARRELLKAGKMRPASGLMTHLPDPHGEPASSAAPAPGICQNCQAALVGPYCGFCGQRAIRIDVSLRELVREGVHEFLHLDSRIFLTLRLLLTRPGQLTADVLAGRRARYVSPIRLYLVCSILFFLTLAALVKPPPPSVALEVDQNLDEVHFSDRGFDRWAKQAIRRATADPEAFIRGVSSRAPKAAFVLVPVFGLLTMATFRRRVRFFVPHLYFALHFHSFVFLALIAVLALGKWVAEPLAALLVLVLPAAYLIAAARRTFETSWGEALWKSLLVATTYCVVLAGTITAVLLLSMLSSTR